MASKWILYVISDINGYMDMKKPDKILQGISPASPEEREKASFFPVDSTPSSEYNSCTIDHNKAEDYAKILLTGIFLFFRHSAHLLYLKTSQMKE
jgi:hypothetical protein